MKKYIDEEGREVSVCDEYTEWLKNGELHQDGDKPAIVFRDGSKEWWKNGECHRDGDKPAIVFRDGSKEWWKNGEIHREGDKPAVVYEDGTKHWYKNGKRHRENNPCYIDTMRTVFVLNDGRNLVEKEYWVRLLLLEY